MQDAVRDLVSRNAVHEVLTRYCQAVDRVDETALRSCFHEGSRHDHGYKGPSEIFCLFALDVLRACVATSHQLGNIAIRITDDSAEADSYFTAYHRLGGSPPAAFGEGTAGMDLIIGGRYLDRFECRGGVWAIVERVGVHDWRRYEAAADRGFFDLPPDQRGRRDRSDPAYR